MEVTENVYSSHPLNTGLMLSFSEEGHPKQHQTAQPVTHSLSDHLHKELVFHYGQVLGGE